MATTIVNKLIYFEISGGSSISRSSSSSSGIKNIHNMPTQPIATFLFILILMCHRSHFHAIETAADVLSKYICLYMDNNSAVNKFMKIIINMINTMNKKISLF